MTDNYFDGIEVDLGKGVAAGFGLKEAPPHKVFPRLIQIHGTVGYQVTRGFFQGAAKEGDWLWTSEKKLRIGIAVADCTAVLVSGNKNNIPFVAAIHAGWRGSAEGILEEAISQIEPDDGWKAWLSPSICQKHFEVYDDVATAFGASFNRFAHPSPNEGKFQFDLKALQIEQLKELGGSMSSSELCTYCDPRLFSFRQMKDDGSQNDSARHLAWIEIDQM